MKGRRVALEAMVAGLVLSGCGGGSKQATATVVPATEIPTYATPETSPPTTVPNGASRNSPLPFGQSTLLQDAAWQVKVLNITSNANQIVATTNQFNDPPKFGHQFFMVTLRVTFQGTGQAKPSGLRFNAVGNSNVGYSPGSADSCGVIPSDLGGNYNDTFTGGTVEGNVCWSVMTPDVDSLVMYEQKIGLASEAPTYFALRGTAAPDYSSLRPQVQELIADVDAALPPLNTWIAIQQPSAGQYLSMLEACNKGREDFRSVGGTVDVMLSGPTAGASTQAVNDLTSGWSDCGRSDPEAAYEKQAVSELGAGRQLLVSRVLPVTGA